MRVEIITVWYNEEFFAEFFLNHYWWADRIHILLDSDTNDMTELVARQYPNVSIEYIRFPEGFDDYLKASYIVAKFDSLTDADYIMLPDADEFIFCYDLDKPVKEHLAETRKDIYFVNLWQIYKHESEQELDPGLPVPQQRRHGDSDMSNLLNQVYIKPIVIKGGSNIALSTGNHGIKYGDVHVHWPEKVDSQLDAANVAYERHTMLQGAHWRLADLEEAIKRRVLNRRPRVSANNIAHGLTLNYVDVTEQDILDEYERHKHDPALF